MCVMKKFIAILLAVMIFATMCVTLTGCGEKEESKKEETTAATQAATQASTKADENPATVAPKADDGDNTDETQGGDDDFYDEDEAIASVKRSAGEDAEVISSYKGYTPQGWEAWVITVQKADGTTATYYAGLYFCIPAEEFEDEDDKYIDEQDAIDSVKRSAGSDVEVVDSYKGYTPQGWEAWVITVQKADGTTATYYSGYAFCIPADNFGSDSTEDYGDDKYIDQQDAINKAMEVEQMDCEVVDSYKGYSPDGFEAWIVTLRRPDGTVVTYYSGLYFIYQAE